MESKDFLKTNYFSNSFVAIPTSLKIFAERMFLSLFLYLSGLSNPISDLTNVGKIESSETNLTWCGEIYQNKSRTAVIKSEKNWTFWCNTPLQSFLQRIKKTSHIKAFAVMQLLESIDWKYSFFLSVMFESIDWKYSFFLSYGFSIYSFNWGTWSTCLKLGQLISHKENPLMFAVSLVGLVQLIHHNHLEQLQLQLQSITPSIKI